jgi:hypothetical protein
MKQEIRNIDGGDIKECFMKNGEILRVENL